jgi:hypothetical protein
MYCLANTLPVPEDRRRVDAAVIAGIGQHEVRVQSYSIVAEQSNDTWQVQITLAEAQDDPLYVNLDDAHKDSAQISEMVAGDLRRRLEGGRWTTVTLE